MWEKNCTTYSIYCICVREWYVPGDSRINRNSYITQQAFPFVCAYIVRELLEGLKTGHSTRSVCLCVCVSVQGNEHTNRNILN